MSDDLVLHHIFNPNDPLATVGEHLETTAVMAINPVELELENVTEAKKLEVEGITSAEKGEIERAVAILTEAIDICPRYASAYNNRAQTLQLKGDVDGALTDLDRAIELSNGQGEAAKQAFTQRGIICKMRGEEEKAACDFQKASNLGSLFARRQLVRMNPYAAMCNKMLSEAIGKLYREEKD
jgi:tetratricopeptide (TPR) repeat protein